MQQLPHSDRLRINSGSAVCLRDSSIGCNQDYSPGYYRKDVHLEETNSIYPTPAQDEIFIPGSIAEKAEKLEVYNLFGQLVCRFIVSVHHEFNKFSLNGLSGGVYFYVIKGNNNQILDSGKFTKLN